MLIYKVLRQPEWDALRGAGSTDGAPVDLADGFIHFSTADQLAETVAKHFAHEDDLVLVAVPAAKLGNDLKWEASRGGAMFPHLYRRLSMDDVAWDAPMPINGGGMHDIPEAVA
ncbi:MAG: DUF952 domain-containing protein [Shimia sp.]